MCCFDWFGFFNYPSETEVRRERVAINPERIIFLLIWDTILCDSVDHKGIISRECVFIIFSFNQMKKSETIEIGVTHF